MNVICCQLNIAWEDKLTNYATVRDLIQQSAPPQNSLIVLPEMFSTGFSMNVPVVSENEKNLETETFLCQLAKEYRAYVMGGLVTAGADERGRNECVVFAPTGERICRYTKIFPFSLGGETQYYTAGLEVTQFSWEGFQVAPFICYDLRFPEIFRMAIRKGAQLLTVIANWPIKREDHWVTLLRARAIENQAYVVGVNRSGTDPKYVYPGRSMVIDPHGKILVDAGAEERIVSAEIDVATVLQWRDEFPALKDMRTLV